MERLVNKAKGFKAALHWDISQQVGMTHQERLRIAKELKRRVYPATAPDVRACHPKQ